MPSPLTVHLVARNNEATVEQTLESLLPLNADILVADIGCKDQTINICSRYKATVVRLSLNEDLSQVRNRLAQTSKSKWNLYLEPWETIIGGHQAILDVMKYPAAAYKLSIFQGDVVTKQTRLWHTDIGCKFVNPVFETIPGNAKEIAAYIATLPHQDELTVPLVEKWLARSPLATEPIYYMACAHLSSKNWDSFLNFAELYLHQENGDGMSVYMARYYSAMVKCYIKKEYHKAVHILLPCLLKCPMMAEFWCLLADVYYAAKEYERAKAFYENAIILGSRRLKDDGWPMEISKYQEYPTKMMEACDKIRQSSRIYAASQPHNSHHRGAD